MSLATVGYMSTKWRDGAARRRVHARFRARLIKLLGLPVEDLTTADDRYAMTTSEFLRECRIEFPRVKKVQKKG